MPDTAEVFHYTPDEVAAMMRVSRRTVVRLVQSGDLPRVPWTRRLLIPAKTLPAAVDALNAKKAS